MAAERGYDRQVGGASPAGLPQASAGAFGAGIGDGVAAIGGALRRADQVDRQIRTDTEIADFNRQHADLRAAADRMSIDMRAQNLPDHAERLASWWKDQSASLAEGITDRRARQQAQAQLDDFGGRFGTAEYAWAQGARVKKLVADEDKASDLAENRAYRNHDRQAFDQELALARPSIMAMVGVPVDTQEALIRRRENKIAFGFMRGQADTSPKTVAALLDNGDFDDLLTPEQQRMVRNTAAARIHGQEAEARATASQAVRVEREELGAAEDVLNAGAGTYQDRMAVASRYEAIGDKSKAEHWRGKGAEFSTLQGTRDWTLPQMDERITALVAKQQGGGLSGGEAHELGALRDQRTQSASRLDGPGGALAQYQYASGRAIEQLVPGDPASMRRRATQAIAAADSYNRPVVEPLLDADLQPLRDLAAGGAAQRLQALDQIRGFGDPRAIAGAARQVAGAGDGAFRIAATLPRDVARDVLSGDDALKTNAGVWKNSEAMAVLNQYYGKPLSFAGEGYRPDVFAAAKSFYAARMTRGGEIAWNAGRFAEALETVMGRTVDSTGQVRGGVARTDRGVVLVPPGVKPGDLMAQFARATPAAYAQASGGRSPRWGDDARMSERDFKQLLPTALGGGRYGFRGRDGGLIHDDRGGIYSIRLADLR